MSQTIGNPQISQGTLNRIRGAIQVPNYPALNVTASFLGEGGITLSWSSPATTMINTLTGRVVSPEPYQAVSVGIHLVKSQSLAAQWEAQRVNLAAIGNMLVFTDAMTLQSYALTNCAIENVGEMTFNGKSSEYMVTVMGTYIVNNALFALGV